MADVVLVVGGDSQLVARTCELLADAGLQTRPGTSIDDAERQLSEQQFAGVVLTSQPAGGTCAQAVRRLMAAAPIQPLALFGGGDVDGLIADCVDAGVLDYLRVEEMTAELLLRAVRRGQSRRRSPDRGPGADRPPRRRLLLIDDDHSVRGAVSDMLSHFHDVVPADSASLALTLLERRADYDAILCDVMMPKMDGAEFAGAVRTQHPRLAERIALFSGGSFDGELSRRVLASGLQLLVKPVPMRTLLEVIEELAAGD